MHFLCRYQHVLVAVTPRPEAEQNLVQQQKLPIFGENPVLLHCPQCFRYVRTLIEKENGRFAKFTACMSCMSIAWYKNPAQYYCYIGLRLERPQILLMLRTTEKVRTVLRAVAITSDGAGDLPGWIALGSTINSCF